MAVPNYSFDFPLSLRGPRSERTGHSDVFCDSFGFLFEFIHPVLEFALFSCLGLQNLLYWSCIDGSLLRLDFFHHFLGNRKIGL